MSCRRLAILAATVVASAAASAAPALASAPAAQCPAAPVSNPFAPWGDNANYQLAANVEDAGASWSLAGGAAAAAGNETFMVGSPSDHLSMRLPAGSTATTGRMCLGSEHPTFRFFAKRSGGSAISRLRVDVVVNDATGREWSLPVGLVAATGAWAPTSALRTVIDILAGVSGAGIQASFRFKPIGSGVWSVDDVYVDPFRVI
jgi:hypothetical protein